MRSRTQFGTGAMKSKSILKLAGRLFGAKKSMFLYAITAVFSAFLLFVVCTDPTGTDPNTTVPGTDPANYTLTVSVSPAGGGSFSRNPDAASYTSGTSVTVTATAASGYRFKNWSGASTSTSNTVTITMNGNKTLTAVFELQQTQQVTTYCDYGPITEYGGGCFKMNSADDCDLEWGKVVSVCGTTEPPNTSTSYTLTTGVTPANSGNISRNPNAASYTSGTSVTVTATAASGYTFKNWSGASTSTSNSVTITMDGNKTLTAVFEPTSGGNPTTTTYELTTGVTPTGSGSVSRSPNATRYESGTSVRATATAASGYKFLYWRGASESTSNPVTITMNSDKTLIAYFESTSTGPGTGPGTNPDPCSNATAPSAPTGLTARWLLEGSSATIRWNSVSGATSYRVYGAPQADYIRLGSAIYDEASYRLTTVTTLSANITTISSIGTGTLIFWVKAVNSCSDVSNASNWVELK